MNDTGNAALQNQLKTPTKFW